MSADLDFLNPYNMPNHNCLECGRPQHYDGYCSSNCANASDEQERDNKVSTANVIFDYGIAPILIVWRLVWLFVFKFDFTIFGNIRKLIGQLFVFQRRMGQRKRPIFFCIIFIVWTSTLLVALPNIDLPYWQWRMVCAYQCRWLIHRLMMRLWKRQMDCVRFRLKAPHKRLSKIAFRLP